MKNKVIIWGLILVFSAAAFMPTVYAADAGEQRVTLGADLNADQITQIYDDFNINRGDVKELFVTNKEERKYLSGLVDEETIGTHALSSIFITVKDEGSGIHVSTKNINWCTADMYENALVTAGIEDADIIISAPFNVSGTAALTGIYKAYSDITGVPLDEVSKAAAMKELVVTGDLAEVVGSDEAVQLVNELKKILDQTEDMTDDELREEILYIANAQNLSLTEDNIRQIISLTRTLENVDFTNWQERALRFGNFMMGVQQAGDDVADFFDGVKNFFIKIGDFFKGE